MHLKRRSWCLLSSFCTQLLIGSSEVNRVPLCSDKRCSDGNIVCTMIPVRWSGLWLVFKQLKYFLHGRPNITSVIKSSQRVSPAELLTAELSVTLDDSTLGCMNSGSNVEPQT